MHVPNHMANAVQRYGMQTVITKYNFEEGGFRRVAFANGMNKIKHNSSSAK